MWSQQVFLVLLAPLLGCFATPESPCPQYFTYGVGREGSTIATVSVPISLDQLPVTLRLHLIVRVALKTKYVGMLLLANNPTLVLGNLLAGRTKLVNYTVTFPLPSPLPQLIEITINNKTICNGEEVEINNMYGGVITNIYLQHTFPAEESLIKNKIGGGDESRVQSEKETTNDKEDLRCGKSTELYSGEKVEDGKERWPWLVAIFLRYNYDLRFHCSGSLISRRHVVTAAHCVRNQINRTWNASSFIVYLGLHSLGMYEEPTSQVREVKNIQIHPEYNELNYMADIAILIIESAALNKYVQPVCLWYGGTSLKPLIGHLGTVVGWGLDKTTKRIRSKPEVFHLPIVDQAECLRSRKEFLYITSERTLCAGLRNGTGPCNGDSGSGLLILSYNNKNSLAWHLRGIISLSLLDRKKETCDLNEYIVFTDIARFNHWISHITVYY